MPNVLPLAEGVRRPEVHKANRLKELDRQTIDWLAVQLLSHSCATQLLLTPVRRSCYPRLSNHRSEPTCRRCPPKDSSVADGLSTSVDHTALRVISPTDRSLKEASECRFGWKARFSECCSFRKGRTGHISHGPNSGVEVCQLGLQFWPARVPWAGAEEPENGSGLFLLETHDTRNRI